MKPTSTRNQLRPRTLDADALEKVAGGRGGFCGSQLHCDCGYTWEFYGQCFGDPCGYDFRYETNGDYCPACGAATSG